MEIFSQLGNLPQLVVSGIAVGMIYGIIAFGYQLTFSTSKTFNFGQGEALESLKTKVEGVVTTYDSPFTKDDHEAISPNIPVMGIVKGARVEAVDMKDLAGDKALRVKPKS